MSSCTKIRVPDSHIWPWWKKVPKSAPSTAMSRSASGQTMFADLPPSSSVTFLMVGAAAARIFRPVAVDPVKATLSTSGFSTSSMPASTLSAVTTLSTPLGSRPVSSMARTTASALSGVCGAGLSTMELPMASAGAIFHIAKMSG
jgi:hypothetical protein